MRVSLFLARTWVLASRICASVAWPPARALVVLGYPDQYRAADHVMEILENGLPLAYALDELLEGVEVVLFRDRVTSTPVRRVGNAAMQAYAREISASHLLGKHALSER